MLSEKMKHNVMRINALLNYYKDLSLSDLEDKSLLKDKMYLIRRQILELTLDIKKQAKEFENRLWVMLNY